MKGIYHSESTGLYQSDNLSTKGYNGNFCHRAAKFLPNERQLCSLTWNVITQASAFKDFMTRSVYSGANYVSGLSLKEAGSVFTPVMVSVVSAAMKDVWLNRLLTREGFQALYHAAIKMDKAVLNPGFRQLGLNIRYILTDLPIMEHAFYSKPAETSRAIIGWLTDSVAGKVLSCSIVSSLLASGIEVYKEVASVRNAEKVDVRLSSKEALGEKIENHKALSAKKVVGDDDLKGLIISAAIASVFTGPLAGFISAGAATGARIGVRKLSRMYCQHQIHLLEAEMARVMASDAEKHHNSKDKSVKDNSSSVVNSMSDVLPLDGNTLGDISIDENTYKFEYVMDSITKDIEGYRDSVNG